MDADISLAILMDGVAAPETSRDLIDLEDKLRNSDIAVISVHAPPVAGQKDVGLVIALQIGSLIVSSISALVGVFQFWLNQRPHYSITLKRADSSLTVDRLSPAAAEKFLTDAKHSGNIVVEIHRK